MCMSSAPKPPPPPTMPPPPPTPVDASVTQSRVDEQRKAKLRAGYGSTIVTGNSGLTQGASTGKTVLG